jgi:2-isopropylmalate synthase
MTGPDGETTQEAAVGDGPVDAALKAMARATATEFELVGMQVRSVSEGEDAQGEAALTARIDGVCLSGRAVDTDIVAACAQAFLDILNRAHRRQHSPASRSVSQTPSKASPSAPHVSAAI